MTSTTTAHDGGGASESRGEQINTAEEEVVERSNLPDEEKEEDELSTADEQGPVSSTNEESWKVVEEATLEQILPLDHLRIAGKILRLLLHRSLRIIK